MMNCKNSEIIGYSLTSEELSNLHDIYDQLNTDEGNKKTTYILQFIWRDLTSSFDVIGPYFNLSGSVEARFLHSMVTKTMLVLHQFGFHVRALVCDGASSNLSLLKVMCNLENQSDCCETPWFISPFDEEKTFAIICPSHQVYKPIFLILSFYFTLSVEKYDCLIIQFQRGWYQVLYQ